jgi:peptide/nickel transport system substrate-binding protein
MINRFRFSILAFLTIFALVLAACGGATEAPAAEPTEAPAAEPTEAPEEPAAEPTEAPAEPTEAPAEAALGGNLVWATNSEPETLDPSCTFSSIADNQYKTLYDSLVFWDARDQNFHPYLAESWEISDDFMSYTFNLRDNVMFHDGTPLNAEAVKINFDRIAAIAALEGEEACSSASVAQARLGSSYDSSEVIDDFTVKVNFTSANPIFLTNATDLYFMSPASLEEFSDEDIARNAVGSGAFILDEWVEQSSMRVVRNEDYNWGPANAEHEGPAYLESITWRFIPESTTRLASLEAGEVHLVNRVESEQYTQLVANPDLVTMALSSPGTPNGLVLNVTLPPMDDIRVRQAIAHSVDRQLMLDVLFDGIFPLGTGPLTSATWSYWPGVEDYFQYDPELASELLAEAGWADSDGDGVLDKDGEPLVLSHMELSSLPDRAIAAEFMQAQMAEIGIQFDLSFAEPGVVVDECHGARRHICGLRWRMADPSTLSAVWASSNIGSGFNWSHMADDEIDSLLEAGVAEPDREVRAQIYQDLQKRIMDLVLWIPLWDVQISHGAAPEFQGWFALPNPEYIWLYDAYIEE